MSDREATDLQKAVIDEAFFLRGRIVSHYSHAEFLLGDFAVKCHALGLYRPNNFKFPYRLESKLAAVREISQTVDIMKKYEGRIGGLINQIMMFEEMRHFMAHGWMMLKYNKVQNLIEMRMYDQAKNEPLKLQIREFSIDQMRSFSEAASKFVEEVMHLFREIYLTEKLETS